MKKIILSLLFVCLALSYSYNLQSTSTCITYDSATGGCSKWSQTGSIEMDTSCFVGQTLVMQKTKGLIQIKNLQVGDLIVTMKNGQQTWSQVEGWIHKSEEMQGSYLNITLDNNEWIGVSSKHNIAFTHSQQIYEYEFPSNKNINSVVYPSGSKMVSKEPFIKRGKYAPLTSQSSYLVYSSEGSSSILAHDLAHIKDPQNYQKIAAMIFKVSKIFNGDHHLNQDGMNVAAQWMMNKFGFLMA